MRVSEAVKRDVVRRAEEAYESGPQAIGRQEKESGFPR